MPRSLKVAIERRPHTAVLLDGTIPAPLGLNLEFVEVTPINRAFRRMVRDLEFDVSEMAVVTHYLARSRQVPLVALPIFLAGHYPHPTIEAAAGSGISLPTDLNGKRVGSRSYTMTSALWARGALARQFGVDLGQISWVAADEDHIPDIQVDAKLERAPGADLKAMLRSGELDAGIGLGLKDESVRPLWPETAALEAEWYALAGGPPINHTVVVREALLDETPGLAEALTQWFAAGRQSAVTAGQTVAEYGLTAANEAALETLLDITHTDFPHEAGLPDRARSVFMRGVDL